jgi:HD-like signal output (HDOD) protein
VIPPFQGHLSTFGFADLLQWMEMNRRSGRLTLMRGKNRRVIDWKDGEIAYVSGSHPRDRLGAFLNANGVIPTATLHALLARNFTSSTNLSRLILEGRHETLSGLSRLAEELARRLLFEVFEWRDGVFRYDPDSRVEMILKIRLKLRPQVLSFQAAKHVDDARRRRRRSARRGFRAAIFEEDELDERFWKVLERVGTLVEPEEGRRRLTQLRSFADRLRRRLGSAALRPIHEDSAALLRELMSQKSFEPAAIAPIAALDEFLAIDLLVLANSLIVDRRRGVATAVDALDRLGRHPVAVLVERLASSTFPRALAGDRAAVTVRRASIAAAVAARALAPEFEVDPERAYTLGLLHTVPYADLLAVVEEMKVDPGPFRAAMIDAYRPLVGRRRAEGWSLPSDLESVLADDGTDARAAPALVRAARAALPDCALGSLAPGVPPPRNAPSIAAEANALFAFLGLPPARVPGR